MYPQSFTRVILKRQTAQIGIQKIATVYLPAFPTPCRQSTHRSDSGKQQCAYRKERVSKTGWIQSETFRQNFTGMQFLTQLKNSRPSATQRFRQLLVVNQFTGLEPSMCTDTIYGLQRMEVSNVEHPSQTHKRISQPSDFLGVQQVPISCRVTGADHRSCSPVADLSSTPVGEVRL
nr:hypothetical protein Iba_scaffold3960CG0010 [Ipomoea batatas]